MSMQRFARSVTNATEPAKFARKDVVTVGVMKGAKNRTIAVNDRGLRIGESHPRAVLTDQEVGWLLELRAEGYSLAWLAGKFEISKSCAAKICRGQNRAQVPAGFRRERVRG